MSAFWGQVDMAVAPQKVCFYPKRTLTQPSVQRVFVAISGALFQLGGRGRAAPEIVIESSSYISKTKGLAELRNVRLVRYAKRHHCKECRTYSLRGEAETSGAQMEEQMKRRQF